MGSLWADMAAIECIGLMQCSFSDSVYILESTKVPQCYTVT